MHQQYISVTILAQLQRLSVPTAESPQPSHLSPGEHGQQVFQQVRSSVEVVVARISFFSPGAAAVGAGAAVASGALWLLSAPGPD